MSYIKKLVVKGFKSFASETEIPFINGMNSIVGPNGSGKSNITDSICFVLGRLSAKSIRASKSANLIFAGTKEHKPSSEASVSLVFDNSDKKFSLPDKEVAIERIVRHNGQSIYKINKEVKTRQEVLELLAFAGIDPYGFNIVLQGEINSIIRKTSEERRQVLEEVAGISIYESRKEKSLKEMEKTDERLKEVQSILRERTSYLRNLEEERKQALKFKKYQELEKKYKASILKKKLDEKKKEILAIDEKKEAKEKEKTSLREKAEQIQARIEEFQHEINSINVTMQKASGIEQDNLNNQISDLRAELSGLHVNKTNTEERIQELQLKRKKTEEEIKKLELEILGLRKEFPSQAKKHQELENKKKELGEIEKSRKIFLSLKEKLNSIRQLSEDKEKHIQKNKNSLEFLMKEIESLSEKLEYQEAVACQKSISNLKSELVILEKSLIKKEKEFLEQEKMIYLSQQEISNTEKIKSQVSALDICPLCKSKITPEHIKQVFLECDEKMLSLQEKIKKSDTNKLEQEISVLKENLEIVKNKTSKSEIDMIKLENIEGKKENLKNLASEKQALENELLSLEKEKKILENKVLALEGIEEKYDRIFLELEEISSRSQENLNAELEFKERNLVNFSSQIKQSHRQEQELASELEDIEKEIDENQSALQMKEQEEQALEKKFEKLIEKKSGIEKQAHESNVFFYEQKNKIALIDNGINNLKVEKAGLDAQFQNLEIDFKTYEGIEIISLPLHVLEAKLLETSSILQTIGSVNLRALEVYDKMKEEYDEVAKKAELLEKEKLEILKIIEEIDKKKKKTLTRTLEDINNLFNRNFTQLSSKGQAFLELENPSEPFSAGLNIVIKVGKGKYFDVTSLSGGEQTLVALSLIFAIQEYKPYSFYIFDEVDAALDKRNSEKLAGLVKRYMKTGQYIIVTHNDSIITESTTLYGVSMQEGISKVLSLEI